MPEDITLRPPPCYTRERADRIYGEAFLRAMEFVSYQKIPGDVLEFGVWNGYTARLLAQLLASDWKPEAKLMLFDSFEGFPDSESEVDRGSYEWREGWWQPGGTASVAGADELIKAALEPVLPGRVKVFKGWFKDTMRHLPDDPPSLVHIDCDLHESTMVVLNALALRRLCQQGMVVLFDDWNNGRGSRRLGERRALADCGFWKEHLEPWYSYGWGGQVFIFQE